MKWNRNDASRLLALLLIMTISLSGCTGLWPSTSMSSTEMKPAGETIACTEAAESSVPPNNTEQTTTTNETEPPINPDDEALIRWQNAGQRDYLPDVPVKMVPFSEMKYIRPDVEAICAGFESLAQQASGSTDAEALLEEYYRLSDLYTSFYSMDALANVLYSLDTTESYYQDEYNYCEAEQSNIEEKLETVYKAFAACPCRTQLETLYFGEGFFEKYDDYEVYTNPEYLRLSQEEAALLTEYRDLTSDIQVTYQGQTKPLDEWLQTDDYEVYFGALQAYYEEYNASIGDVFLRLVKVRQQLADTLGYDSYAEYSYDLTYARDYSPEEGEAFVAAIRSNLVPILQRAEANRSLSRLSYGTATEASLQKMLRSAAQNLGGTVWDAYRFMEAYELCDTSKSSRKLDASFQTYLFDYESPFVFLNAQGNGHDYTTFAHEFGHFTDSYYNYGASEDLETAETFSQSMEFLAVTYTDTLTAQQKETLLKLKLKDLLETFVYQAAYADFEARVYALDPEQLSLEAVNDLFLQCCIDHGIYIQGFDFYYSQSWIDVLHFFEVPYYIISYCVSAGNALQVYRLETETAGEGVAAYFRLLDRDYEAGVQQVMEDADLESPFHEGVLEQTAEFFTQELGLQ